jgi:hypothetical protein
LCTVHLCTGMREEIETRRKAFIRKWRLKHRAVADSLEEACDRLFTSYCNARASLPVITAIRFAQKRCGAQSTASDEDSTPSQTVLIRPSRCVTVIGVIGVNFAVGGCCRVPRSR